MCDYLLLEIKNRRIFVQSDRECSELARIGRVSRHDWELGVEVRKGKRAEAWKCKSTKG